MRQNPVAVGNRSIHEIKVNIWTTGNLVSNCYPDPLAVDWVARFTRRPSRDRWSAPRVSISRERGIAIAVERRIAKHRLGDAGAFHEEADVMFIGHPDAAMHLHPFIAGEVGGV